jgi:hypothetical protein
MAYEHDHDDAEAIEDLELDGTESDIDEVIGGSVPRPPEARFGFRIRTSVSELGSGERTVAQANALSARHLMCAETALGFDTWRRSHRNVSSQRASALGARRRRRLSG